MEVEAANAPPLRWWHFRRRLNGKFYLTLMALISLGLVVGATYFRVGNSQGVTLEQLQDWRTETTKTWHATIEQMGRIEAQQREILTRLNAKKGG